MYRLGFPNLEEERGFTRFLIPYYTLLKSDQGQLFVANFVKEASTSQQRPDESMTGRLRNEFINFYFYSHSLISMPE